MDISMISQAISDVLYLQSTQRTPLKPWKNCALWLALIWLSLQHDRNRWRIFCMKRRCPLSGLYKNWISSQFRTEIKFKFVIKIESIKCAIRLTPLHSNLIGIFGSKFEWTERKSESILIIPNLIYTCSILLNFFRLLTDLIQKYLKAVHKLFIWISKMMLVTT
jgi:hypothetical protein